MTEAETCLLLVALLREQEPFIHVRFGDGDIFFMSGTGPVITGDGEEWSEGLMRKLVNSWMQIADYDGRLLLGDVSTYAQDDGCAEQWAIHLELFRERRGERPFEFVHMEALRVGFGFARPVYEEIRDDPRHKVFVGPLHLQCLADRLRADHLEVPLQIAHTRSDTIAAILVEDDPEVILFAAGRGGKIVQGQIAQDAPHITQIDIGSGLDLLVANGVRRGTDLGLDRQKIISEYRAVGLAP